MEEIAISKFKATCLSVLERVRRTGQSILITRHGEPVAEIIAPPTPERPESWLGSMKDTLEIKGDIVDVPALPAEGWEALRDKEWEALKG